MNWIRTALRTQTISERYADVGSFTNGFDYVRLILAALVVVLHSFGSSYGLWVDTVIWGTPFRSLAAPILLMFFALSGFLVAGSLKRQTTLIAFVTLRALRLMPALAVEVLLSALILGPMLTTLTLPEYFRHSGFLAYLGNMVGRIRMILPGVFSENPSNVVNVSLWTVPYELECYLVLTLLWMTGLLRKRSAVAAVTIIAIAAGTWSAFAHFNPALTVAGNMPRSLITAFLVGVCASLYSDVIQLDWRMALTACIGLLSTTQIYQTVFVASIFAAYLVIYAGMSHPPKKTFLFRGDYSYGLYLFAAPIQQTYTHLFPEHRVWYLNAVAALFLGLCYAAFSWWVIEKPILGHKRALVALAESTATRLMGFFTSKPV